jgi:hypothetical protein
MDNLWRTGRHVPINVYEGDIPVCQCQTADYARRIVSAVNGCIDTVKEYERMAVIVRTLLSEDDLRDKVARMLENRARELRAGRLLR